ncbi:MAG: response regulator transcription factor [Actinobacteria bacterium]|nr:response regulator transcription factor [Actinomycetota bacterium]
MIVVAHREGMVAEGIAAALAQFPAIVPAGVASSAAEAEVRGETADAVALDESLPGADAATIRLRRRGVRVVLLGAPSNDVDPDVDEGGVRVSTAAPIAVLARALVPGLPTGEQPRAGLTTRERQILGLVARGLAAKQVARQLGISAKTVERHKTRMFSKLGVANQTAAVNLAVTTGLVKEPTWA